MSYTVLARKYRSATFDELIGQGQIAQTLKRAIESGRIAHAFLFCGTRGTGKTSMARILAKALNCEKSKGPTTEPCGKCSSCQAIARGDDIDVIEIDAASNTGVDNVREIIENSQYRPARSRFKIYIIDEAHMLSKPAFNALLKTLEEPPEHVKFILATTEPEKLLPTILSRCQRYDFRNIPTREIASHLKDICRKEKIKADEDALLLVAKAGAGSMRDSLSLLDRLLSVGEKELTVEMIEQLLGMPRAQSIFELAQAIGAGDVKSVLQLSTALTCQGLGADTMISSLADHLRNLLVILVCGADSELVELPGIAMQDLQSQAACFDAVVLSQDIAILEELRRQMRGSGAARALLDATLVRLALAGQFTSIDQLLSGERQTPTAAKKKVELISPAALKAPAPPAMTAADEEDDLPQPGKVWQDKAGPSLVELLKQQSSTIDNASPTPLQNVEPVNTQDFEAVMSRLRDAIHEQAPGIDAFLSHGKLVGVESGQAILRYPSNRETSVQMLSRNGKKEIVQKQLSEILNEPVGLRFEIEPEPAAEPVKERAAPARPAPRREVVAPAPPVIRVTPELKEQLRADPLVAAVIDELGGEIVKVE
jgi:DNA polymerase-3 subunit gamma/tau